MSVSTHSYLWAKQENTHGTYPLLAHLLDTAAVAGVLYDHWLRPGLQELFKQELGQQARSIVCFIAGSHDVGKASPLFQGQFTRKAEVWDSIRKNILNHLPQAFNGIERLTPREIRNSTLRRHEQISALALGFLSKGEPFEEEESRASWQCLPALGHHGYFTIPFNADIPHEFVDDTSYLHQKFTSLLEENGWTQAQDDLLSLLEQAVGICRKEFPDEVSNTVIVLLSGLTILADRIASHSDWVAQNQQLMANGTLVLEKPNEWVAALYEQALHKVEETVGVYHGWEDEATARQAILGDYEPRPMQAEALRSGGGLWNVMVQTGGGKTEAALLRHCTEQERLLFLLPTQATSNALMRRVQKFYEGTPNVAALAHGLASIEDFYQTPVTSFGGSEIGDSSCVGQGSGGLYPTEFVRSGAARLLAPVFVGTVDQALMGSLPLKWTHLRLLALANSHIVVDEVHTLDHYQTQLLVTLLEWLGKTNTRVTLLTATLPQWQRQQFLEAYTGESLADHSIIPSFPATELLEYSSSAPETSALPSETYSIDFSLDTVDSNSLEDSHIMWVRSMRERFPKARIGVICNTVQRAQTVAAALEQEYGGVVLLHSRMTAEHRRINAQQLEALIGAGKTAESVIVVGTQAIEASLDIDLDFLSTDLCPSASLIQRAGRVWRRSDVLRAERIPGVPHIPIRVVRVAELDKYSSAPYFQAELERTWSFLIEHQHFVVPADNQRFIDSSSLSLDTFAHQDDDAFLEAFADIIGRIRAGLGVAAPLEEALADEATITEFKQLTQRSGDEESAERRTRLIERESTPVILCCSDGSIPGAWDGAPEDLAKITPQEQQKIRQALKGSLPLVVSSSKLSEQLVSLADAPSLLKRYSYLPQAERFYDSASGFSERLFTEE
ncbi:CRISPR-associated helicase Cas3' [Rothia sp. CCM 9418]|uniref:CRISPR-associated helicase Cas3' n=1 Tax=Rothia sp. CCM 9418 TaxID=3402661 RepID=UPI003AE7EE51